MTERFERRDPGADLNVTRPATPDENIAWTYGCACLVASMNSNVRCRRWAPPSGFSASNTVAAKCSDKSRRDVTASLPAHWFTARTP